MSKEKDKKDSVLKSFFFLKLFTVPSICWGLLSLWVMFIPDEPGEEPITWLDFFGTTLLVVFIWFIISFIIALIINEVKKNKQKLKNGKEVQYITKPDEKIVAKHEDINSKEKTKNKCLYTCENKIDAYEYKKMAKYFPQMYWNYVTWGTILNLIITAIIAILGEKLVGTVIFLLVFQIYMMVLYKVRLEHFVEKSFNSLQKKGRIDTEIHTEFYEKYLIRKGQIETIKINYCDIDRFVETDTNLYLKFDKRNKVIIIQKSSCNLELINFIRGKFKNPETSCDDYSNFKGVKKYHNPSFIKIFMIILFIITICSLWGALWTMNVIDKITPQHGFNFVKNSWAFWCWLPVPLLSIILGFKYKNVGFKCTKNIVAGFIIGFLLLVYGSLCLLPMFSQDYRCKTSR